MTELYDHPRFAPFTYTDLRGAFELTAAYRKPDNGTIIVATAEPGHPSGPELLFYAPVENPDHFHRLNVHSSGLTSYGTTFGIGTHMPDRQILFAFQADSTSPAVMAYTGTKNFNDEELLCTHRLHEWNKLAATESQTLQQNIIEGRHFLLSPPQDHGVVSVYKMPDGHPTLDGYIVLTRGIYTYGEVGATFVPKQPQATTSDAIFYRRDKTPFSLSDIEDSFSQRGENLMTISLNKKREQSVDFSGCRYVFNSEEMISRMVESERIPSVPRRRSCLVTPLLAPRNWGMD